MEDWSTERIFDQLHQLGIDTDAERFPAQAAAAGRFTIVEKNWVGQIPDEKTETGFWADFPLICVRVLWARLASHLVCSDLIEERLYRVIQAEETGKKLPDVDGMPADVAAALALARFLLAVEPAQRAARFEEVNDRRFYDYFDWLTTLIGRRGPEFPDAAKQIAEALSECCDGDLVWSDLAMALACAGRVVEAVSLTRYYRAISGSCLGAHSGGRCLRRTWGRFGGH